MAQYKKLSIQDTEIYKKTPKTVFFYMA